MPALAKVGEGRAAWIWKTRHTFKDLNRLIIAINSVVIVRCCGGIVVL